MYNDPQNAYQPPQPNPQWNGNNGYADATQHFYAPPAQNPATQMESNGAVPFQAGSYASTQQVPPQVQWSNSAPPFQPAQPAQSPAPVSNGMVYRGLPRRSGLIPSRGGQKNNLSMVMIGGATALALIVGLAFFVILSNQGAKPNTAAIQADVATPTAMADAATPTPEATSTPMPTPTLVPTPTPAPAPDTTTTSNLPVAAPPPARAPAPTSPPPPKPTVAPTPVPTVDPESFTYDYNPTNGTLVTNPPADFCTAGHEAANAGVKCVSDFFTNAGGYVVTCADGKYVSHNGGKGGCGQYGGEGKKWYKHPIKK